ncbi:MAG: glycosyltransferase family 2 protein [Thiotrichales bacterium]
MLVSVVIPTHNRAHLLARALDSVLAQTLPALEIIVVDDGSTDDTQVLVAERYPQCIYLKQPQVGVSAARNAGIQAASGDWIAFLDSDDAWLPGKLEAQRDCLAENPGVRLCHCEEIWIRQGRRVNPMRKHAKTGGWIYQRCLPLCVISPSAALLHRSLLEDVGAFDESLPACEDYDLWLRICAQEPVAFVDQPQIEKYGGHDDQLSQRYWGMDRFRIQALEKMLQKRVLTESDRSATLQTLIDKCGIFAQGAAKRNKLNEARLYGGKKECYAEALAVVSL